jgi:hypothetical protein
MAEYTELSGGRTAEEFYQSEKKRREPAVEIGQRLSRLTVPSAFLDESWEEGSSVPKTNQSVGAYAVNGLANSLMQGALPVNLPILVYLPDEAKLGPDIEADPELWSRTELALARREVMHRNRMATTTARSAYTYSAVQLILVGNCLWLWTDINNPIVYSLHHYVVRRSATGKHLETVLCTKMDFVELDDDLQEAVAERRKAGGQEPPKDDDVVTVYHCQRLAKVDGKHKYVYWQELDGGIVVEGSEAYCEPGKETLYPSALHLEAGSNYAFPYALDYEGDLEALENLGAALLDGAAALAMFLLFVKNNTATGTKVKKVQEARNLDVLEGSADDVTATMFGKSGDMSFVDATFEKVSRRVGFAFSSKLSIQRSGERVTAQEWREMVNALSESMGSTYVLIAQTTQSWVINRFIFLHGIENELLEELPEGLVHVRIISGLDNVGATSDYENLKVVLADAASLVGPEAVANEIVVGEVLRRLMAGKGVKPEGLTKSTQQKDAETRQGQERMAQQAMVEQGTGPLAKGGMDMMAQMMGGGMSPEIAQGMQDIDPEQLAAMMQQAPQ